MKKGLSGIPTRVHYCLPGLTLYQCCHLVAAQKARTVCQCQPERLVRFYSALRRRAVPTTVKRTSLSGWHRLEVLAFWAAYQVATLVKRKSWKAMMDSCWDPREAFFPSLGLIVNWLLAVTKNYYIRVARGRTLTLHTSLRLWSVRRNFPNKWLQGKAEWTLREFVQYLSGKR